MRRISTEYSYTRAMWLVCLLLYTDEKDSSDNMVLCITNKSVYSKVWDIFLWLLKFYAGEFWIKLTSKSDCIKL